MTPTKILLGRILITLGLAVRAICGARQWAAAERGHQARFGAPWFMIERMRESEFSPSDKDPITAKGRLSHHDHRRAKFTAPLFWDLQSLNGQACGRLMVVRSGSALAQA